jgi:hypothetical protein
LGDHLLDRLNGDRSHDCVDGYHSRGFADGDFDGAVALVRDGQVLEAYLEVNCED